MMIVMTVEKKQKKNKTKKTTTKIKLKKNSSLITGDEVIFFRHSFFPVNFFRFNHLYPEGKRRKKNMQFKMKKKKMELKNH